MSQIRFGASICFYRSWSFLYARRQLYIYSEIMSIYPFGMCVPWGLGLCQMGHLRVSTLILCLIHTKISIHMCWMNANIFSSKPMGWLQLKFLLVRLNWTQHDTIWLDSRGHCNTFLHTCASSRSLSTDHTTSTITSVPFPPSSSLLQKFSSLLNGLSFDISLWTISSWACSKYTEVF